MKDPSKTAQMFLEGLTSDSKDTLEILTRLVEELENKVDPDMTEVRLVNQIYKYIENRQLLESNLRSYVKDNRKNLPGKKLSSLYDKLTYNGGGIYRD